MLNQQAWTVSTTVYIQGPALHICQGEGEGVCVVNMCQRGRKYHTSLAMSAADGLFACCVCESVCVCAYTVMSTHVNIKVCPVHVCVWEEPLCVFSSRQLADLACHTHCSLVNKSLKMIDYGGLLLADPVLFVCGTQGNKQHDAPIFSATYGETPGHIINIHIP